MWLALFPLLRNRARIGAAVLGLSWVGLMSLAVVGAHWHTPLDAVGSVVLSIGIVAAGGAVLELPAVRRATMTPAENPRVVKDPAKPGAGVAELLGEAEYPVGVAQAQRINQKKG